MDDLFGLPAHALLVHGAVVLVPLAAVGVALIAFWPAARSRLGWAVLAIAAAGALVTYLAQDSGEALEDRVDETELVEEHAELGESGNTAGLAVLAAAAGVVAADVALRRWRQAGEGDTSRVAVRRAIPLAVGAVAVALASAGAIQMTRIGHSGAKAVWNGTSDGGEDGDDD